MYTFFQIIKTDGVAKFYLIGTIGMKPNHETDQKRNKRNARDLLFGIPVFIT